MTMRTILKLATLAPLALGVLATPASAGTGCNGVVNVFVWGCAPWDNNNGPKFPYFRKQVVRQNVPQGSQVKVDGANAMVNVNGQWKPVSGGSAAVVAAGGGNVVAAGGGNVIAAGGLNLQVIEGN